MSDVIRIAEQLADEFRPRAAQYDRTAEFQRENYDRMREAGYLRAAVPVELGGLGAGLGELSRAQQALARGCASTALAVNMHQFQIGAFSDAYRQQAAAPAEAMLRRVASEGVVLGSTGAEAVVAGPWTPSATAQREDGHYIINGRKFFCSQAPGMDFVRVNVRETETGETLVISLAANAPGVSIAETWDTTGMRATASHDLVLENVRVPETSVGGKLPPEPMSGGPMLNVARWFYSILSGVYLGIAEEAREEAYKAIGSGVNSNSRADVLTDVMVGEMEADFRTARAIRDQSVAELEEFPKDMVAAFTTAMICKETVISKAIATVEKAVEIAGGRAFFKKSPLERLARDVRAGRFHPASAPISFQMIGERTRAARQATAAAAR